jgi:hypothetical protein
MAVMGVDRVEVVLVVMAEVLAEFQLDDQILFPVQQ